MSTKTKSAPKKALKKYPMTLPKKSNLIFQEPSKKSYDGTKRIGIDLDDCCSERTPEWYDQDVELMTSAAQEIKNLREHNRHMSTRLEMFDKMYSLFTADSGRRDGMCSGNDIVRNLEYRVENKKREKELQSSKPQS